MNRLFKKILVLCAILTENKKFPNAIADSAGKHGFNISKNKVNAWRLGEENPKYRLMSFRDLNTALDILIAHFQEEKDNGNV